MKDEKRKRTYTKPNNKKYTVVSETNKILYVGDVNDICAKYSVDRNTVYQASYGKFKIRGKYTLRAATEEESLIEYPHYFKAIIVKRKTTIAKEEREKEEAEVIKNKWWEEEIDPIKPHVKKPYRSSSGHRFTPL